MSAASNYIFENRPDAIERRALELDGALPEALEGRYLINGPGQLLLGGQQLHSFDAFGRIVAAELGDGGVSIVGRPLKTPLYRQEVPRDELLKRRLFHNKPSRWSNLFDLDIGNGCMHNVYAFGPHLIASQDPGHFLLDRDSFEIKERFDFGGLHRKGVNSTPMARVDPGTGHLVAWLQRQGPRDAFTFVELDEELKVAAKQCCKLPAGIRHDIAFTKDYYVLARFGGLNALRVLWGKAPVFSAINFKEDSALMHLVPRAGGTPIAIPLPKRVHFHFFNAFQEDSSLVVDTIGYEGPVTFARLMPDEVRKSTGMASQPTPVPMVIRYRIDLSSKRVEESIVEGVACEAPEVNPACRGTRSRFGYAPAKTPADDPHDPGAYAWFGGLAKIDFQEASAERWESGEGRIVTPPAFVPDPAREGEDAGFLVAWVQDPARDCSSLVVFDAQAVSKGPICRAHHQGLIGLVSHSCWLPGVLG